MWTQPRNTIRAIVQTHPRYRIFFLASLYVLQECFYFAHYWSLGISFPFYAIGLASLALAPLLGVIWLYALGWIFTFTGHWLGGKAPASFLRAGIAWAKIPLILALVMWFSLLITSPTEVFILDVKGSSSLFINLINSILGIWSLVLLLKSIRELQYFSLGRAIVNVALAWLIAALFGFIFFASIRYFYILTF